MEEFNLEGIDYSNKRKYVRIPFTADLSYRICYDTFSTEQIPGKGINISSGGFMFQTKWPPASLAIIEVSVDLDEFEKQLETDPNKKDLINIKEMFFTDGKLYGEVKRVIESKTEFGQYEVGIQLVRKCDI